MRNPRIAHITPIRPSTGGNGLAMRVGLFSEAAAKLGQTLVVVIDHSPEQSADVQYGGAEVRCVLANSRPDTRLAIIRDHTPLAHKSQLLREYGRPSASIPLSMPVIQEVLHHLIQHGPDLIIISRVYLLPLVEWIQERLPSARLLVDLDDDDAAMHLAYARTAAQEGANLQAEWHEAEAEVSDQLITNLAETVSAFACASNDVRRSIEGRLGLTNLITVQNVAPECSTATSHAAVRDQLLFVGNLSYAPNIDAVEWFVQDIWPLLISEKPLLQLCVAGSLPSPKVRSLCSRPAIELVANPVDLGPLYARALAAIVPLRFGSGSRIKILEAGMNKVPVVTTFKGAEGLCLNAGIHAFISDETPAAFMTACLSCLDDASLAAATASNLHQLIHENFARPTILRQLTNQLSRMASPIPH